MFIGELILYIQCLSVWSVALWTSDERICPTNDWILIDVSCEIVVYSARPGPARPPSSRAAEMLKLRSWQLAGVINQYSRRSLGRSVARTRSRTVRAADAEPSCRARYSHYANIAAPLLLFPFLVPQFCLSVSLSLCLSPSLYVCVCVRVCVWCQDHRAFVTCTAID